MSVGVKSIASILPILIMLAVLLVIPVLIGVYVHRDARSRRMNAVLWTLIAVIAPALVGFIIYLLVRGNYPDLECPQCGGGVAEQYVVCPHCGARLRPACPNCSAPVEPDWKVCPRCAAPLDGVEMHPAQPRRRQDKGLKKILIAVIVVPVVLIVLAAFSFANLKSTGGGSLWELTFDEYDEAQKSDTARAAVHEWLDRINSPGQRHDRAYVLQYNYYDEFDAKNKYYYLLYVPGGGRSSTTSFGSRSGLFGSHILELELENTGFSGSLYAVCWQTTDDRPPRPEVTLGGKRVRCEVTEVDYNPTPYVVIPDYADAEFWNGQFLPERLSVVKLVGNRDENGMNTQASENVGVVEVTDKDMMFQILASIDSGERVPMDPEQLPDFDFQDGFEIIVEYQIHEGLIMHEDMARHLVYLWGGECYLHDDRVRNTTHGSPYRVMGNGFYELLEGLFEES